LRLSTGAEITTLNCQQATHVSDVGLRASRSIVKRHSLLLIRFAG